MKGREGKFPLGNYAQNREKTVSSLKFSDGMTINTSGAYRVIRKSDGYYVVGQGMCCPVDNREEGLKFIRSLKGEDHAK